MSTSDIMVVMSPFFVLIAIMTIGFSIQHYLDNK